MTYWIQPDDTFLGKCQKVVSNATNTDTFCILPWIHFATRPNGDMRLCCSSNASGAGSDHTVGLVKNENGVPANFGRDTPMSAWNNEYMKSVRTTMLDGKIPASCTKCFDEESKGVASKRMWETYSWMPEIDIEELVKQTNEDGTVPEKLAYLDLRLGHTCNLKCVMCSPHDSSKWVTEHKKVFPTYKHIEIRNQMQWDEKNFDNYWYEKPEFWEQMYEQIPNLKQVYFAGGEPLMIKEHKLFIEEIIRQGYQDKILLRYNSNGLLLDTDTIDMWKKFKKVKYGFSLDGLADKNYYIRYPSDWETIEKNMHLLDNTPDNIEGSIATAIQIFNVKHLPEFIKWKVNSKFKKINMSNALGGTLAGGGLVNMHLLYIPTFLSIQILPEQDKKEVRELFSELKEWLWNNYTQDDDFWKHNPYGWKRWESVLTHMDSQDHSHLLPSFKEYVEKLDTHRKLNAGKVFPELAHLF